MYKIDGLGGSISGPGLPKEDSMAGGINAGGYSELWLKWFAWYPVTVDFVYIPAPESIRGYHIKKLKTPGRVWLRKIWRRRVHRRVNYDDKDHWEYMRDETLVEKTLRRFQATGITTKG